MQVGFQTVYEFYVDDCASPNDALHRIVCCAAYLLHEDERAPFNRRWRNLLMQHELTRLNLREWKAATKGPAWDLSKRRAVLADFIRLAEGPQALAFVVAVDAQVWASLKPKRRRMFGSAADFCFQRVLRVVLDRMEAVNNPEPIAIVLDQDLASFAERSQVVRSALRLDSRASRRVGSIQFSDPGLSYQLQAAHVLGCMTRKTLAERSGGEIPLPGWLKALTELPTADHPCEFWDAPYMDKHFVSVEWTVPDSGSQKIRTS